MNQNVYALLAQIMSLKMLELVAYN